MDSKRARITRKERRLLLGNSVEGVAIYFTLLFVIEFVACTVKKKTTGKEKNNSSSSNWGRKHDDVPIDIQRQ